MTIAELISILQAMPPQAVVVLGEHNRDTVVPARKHDIALVTLQAVPEEYRETYDTVAGDDAHDPQRVLLGCHNRTSARARY